MEGRQQEFLENLLMQALLEQLEKEVQDMLARGLVFCLPVPRSVFLEVCLPSGQEFDFDDMLNRAIALGVLESNQDGMLRVPQLLSDFLKIKEQPYALASVTLHRAWNPTSNRNLTEEQLRELHRIALLGNQEDIALEVSDILAKRLNNLGRYREVVELCKSTITNNQNNYQLYLQLSHSEAALGNKSEATKYYQQVINRIEHILLESYNIDIQRHITALVEAYVGIADVYHTSALSNEAIQYLDKALVKANEIQDKKIIADIYLLMGIIKKTKGDFLSSIHYISLALNLYKEITYERGVAEATHNLADSYSRLGRLDDAAKLICEAIIKHEQCNNFKEQIWSLSLLGKVYMEQKQFQRSHTILEEAVNRFQDINHLHGLFITTYRLGCLFLAQGFLNEASDCLNNLRQLDTASENSMKSLATGYIKLLEGDVFFLAKRFDEAIESYSNIVEKLDSEQHSWMFSHLKVKLSQAYFAIHEYSSSLHQSEAAITKAQDRQYNDILGAAFSVSAKSLYALEGGINYEIINQIKNSLKFSLFFNRYLLHDTFEGIESLISLDKKLVTLLTEYWQSDSVNNVTLAQLELENVRLEVGDGKPYLSLVSKLNLLLM